MAIPARYTARFALPDLLEQGQDATVQCPVYRAGELVAPSEGTVVVYDRAGEEVFAADVEISDDIAHATVPEADLDGLELSDGWRVEWLLLMPDGHRHRFRNDAHLVRYRLYPTITDADIGRRLRALDPASASVITTSTTYQGEIDEADIELQLRLIERGQRPWLIATPSALRQTWLTLTIAIILEDLAVRDPDAYAARAKDWRARYEAALSSATLQYDRDQDGLVDQPGEREAALPSVVWM